MPRVLGPLLSDCLPVIIVGQFPVLVDVCAGRKGPLTGPGDDDSPNTVVALHLTDGLVQLGDQLQVQGVQYIGTVQRDDSDPVYLVGLNGLATHNSSLLIVS